MKYFWAKIIVIYWQVYYKFDFVNYEMVYWLLPMELSLFHVPFFIY
jgi:hypothetical protein